MELDWLIESSFQKDLGACDNMFAKLKGSPVSQPLRRSGSFRVVAQDGTSATLESSPLQLVTSPGVGLSDGGSTLSSQHTADQRGKLDSASKEHLRTQIEKARCEVRKKADSGKKVDDETDGTTICKSGAADRRKTNKNGFLADVLPCGAAAGVAARPLMAGFLEKLAMDKTSASSGHVRGKKSGVKTDDKAKDDKQADDHTCDQKQEQSAEKSQRGRGRGGRGRGRGTKQSASKADFDSDSAIKTDDHSGDSANKGDDHIGGSAAADQGKRRKTEKTDDKRAKQTQKKDDGKSESKTRSEEERLGEASSKEANLDTTFQAQVFQQKRFEVEKMHATKLRTENPDMSKQEVLKLARAHWMSSELRKAMLSSLSESELKRRRFVK